MDERREIVDGALGSLALEGQKPSLEMRELLERFAEGEVDADELQAAAQRRAEALRATT